MAIALVAHTIVQSTDTNAVTTSAIDTTGSTLLVMLISHQNGSGTGNPSDSKGNTWVLAVSDTGLGFNPNTYLWYVQNPTGKVGSGHTFTGGAAGTFPSVVVLTFSGTDTAASVDQTNHGNGSGTTQTPGSVTTSVDEVFVSGLGTQTTGSFSIGSSFTLTDSGPLQGGAAYGAALAYKIESAATENPTWTVGSSAANSATIATFKALTGVTPDQEVPSLQPWTVEFGPRYV